MNRMERAENQINVQAYVRNLMFQLRHRKLNSQFIKDIFQKRPKSFKLNGVRLAIVGFTEASCHGFFVSRPSTLWFLYRPV